MRFPRRIFQFAILAIAFTALAARTEVKMPAIFGDHMVLQGKAKLPVWGWASPGEKVTVTLSSQTDSTVTKSDGTWRLDLKPVNPSDDEAQTLVVAGQNNTLIFKDVLVGDVWVASGQSNMEFGLQTDSRGKETIANAHDSQIRFFFVPWATALQPQTNIGPAIPPSPLNGKWLVCSPETLSSNWAWHAFSAVAYYFARDIRQVTGQPVGLIGAYKGGTPSQAWTSLSSLEKEPVAQHYVVEHGKLIENLESATTNFPKQQAAFRQAAKTWDAAKVSGQIPTNTPPPKPPVPPDGGFSAPGNLFNGMVAPLIPYAIKGVIWYQGEGNANNLKDAAEYSALFPRLILDWREKWQQENFPFLFVQLPNINQAARVPSEGNWPWVRDAQLKTLSLPKTGMAVTMDVGEADELHPPDKIYVGKRLALAARHVAYGENLVYSGPIYDSMQNEGNKIRIHFKHIGAGLKLGVPPPTATGKTLPTLTELKGFGIAGADRKFVWAKAVIENDSVVVFSDSISQPVAARYDWGQNPAGNLYNAENLPASPFRTDDWPVPVN
jgi:sialate O-acetylesterase